MTDGIAGEGLGTALQYFTSPNTEMWRIDLDDGYRYQLTFLNTEPHRDAACILASELEKSIDNPIWYELRVFLSGSSRKVPNGEEPTEDPQTTDGESIDSKVRRHKSATPNKNIIIVGHIATTYIKATIEHKIPKIL